MRYFVFGAGGLGREMILSISGKPRFIDDVLAGSVVDGREVLSLDQVKHGAVYVGVGDSTASRERITKRLLERGVGARHALFHKTAVVFDSASIEVGTFVACGAVVNVGSHVGVHALVLDRAVIGHDSIIGDFAIVCPGVIISGHCQIGDLAFIGAGAVVLPDVRVGERAIVGAGAVVTRDVPPGETVVGNPARPLRHS